MARKEESHEQAPSAEDRQLNAHFIKSNLFRVVHADGAWGGITPQFNIQVALFSERHPIPTEVSYKLEPSGPSELSRTARDGIVREIEADVIMSLDVARALRIWLDNKIREAEELRAELERRTGIQS